MLPLEAPPRTGGGTEVASFSCGAYSQGRLQGLRANSKRFPNACSVFASFVRHKLPEHPFTTVSLFRNLQTDCHVDSGNLSTPNAVFAISHFRDGGIWVGDGQGPQVLKVKGKAVKGTIMPLDKGPVVFDAYKFPHSTEKWQGERIVLVAYAVKNLAEMHPDQAMALMFLLNALSPLQLRSKMRRQCAPGKHGSSKSFQAKHPCLLHVPKWVSKFWRLIMCWAQHRLQLCL